jgi:hypothetical protein
MLKKIWMATGFILYLAIAVLLPVTVQLLGVFSDVPESWVRLIIPLIFIPFLMGFAQPLFLLPWRAHLLAPAVVMLIISVFSITDGVKNHEFLTQDLIFWPTMIVTYLIFSRLGLLVEKRLRPPEARA